MEYLEEIPLKEKILSLLLVLCILGSLAVPVRASELGKLEPYAQKLIQYYLHHQEAAGDVIWDITRQMKELDPKQGSIWEKILFDWSWINSDMPVFEGTVPDGLPEDNSLCIVVMGFGLNEDGTIRPELEDRLVMALTFALKYPNAYVLVSGGQTGAVDGVTEAGQMAAWLQSKGLEADRIIQEKQSLSTTANAVNCYKLLTGSYPQVNAVAIVTSDYHIAQSCAMFAMVSNYQSGYKSGKSLELVGNAVCDTGNTENSLMTQAWGISLIAGIPFDENAKAPELYPVEIPVEVYTEPLEPEVIPAAEPLVEQEDREAAEASAVLPETERNWLIPAVCVTAALLVLWVMSPKKPKKRNRRQKPKMNWES